MKDELLQMLRACTYKDHIKLVVEDVVYVSVNIQDILGILDAHVVKDHVRTMTHGDNEVCAYYLCIHIPKHKYSCTYCSQLNVLCYKVTFYYIYCTLQGYEIIILPHISQGLAYVSIVLDSSCVTAADMMKVCRSLLIIQSDMFLRFEQVCVFGQKCDSSPLNNFVLGNDKKGHVPDKVYPPDRSPSNAKLFTR